MERAKDLNGLLTLIREATCAVGSANRVLADRNDTESQIQCASLRKVRDQLEFLGRDIAGGVVDLRELPFDERAWSFLFNEEALQLASEPEPEPEVLAAPPTAHTPEQEDLFDFSGEAGDYGLGLPPDLLGDIDTSQLDVDDTPTLVM